MRCVAASGGPQDLALTPVIAFRDRPTAEGVVRAGTLMTPLVDELRAASPPPKPASKASWSNRLFRRER